MYNVKGRMKHQKSHSLGIFTNFSPMIHGIAEAVFNDPLFKVQRATINALNEFNSHSEAYPLSVSGHIGTYRGTLGFEVGVADGVFFNYLDNETVQILCRPLSPKRIYRILDFLIIATYHYSTRRKIVALNFDHYHTRFIFNKKQIEVRLFHSKGIRRMALDELLERVFNKMREKMWHASLGGLTVKKVRVL